MTYLPAPYESAQQDDLAAALGAGLTVATAGITSWVLGTFAVDSIRWITEQTDKSLDLEKVPADLLVPTLGWAAAVILLVLGAVLMVFRRGRGTVIFGALIAVATTAIAQFAYHYNDLTTAPGAVTVPLDRWWLYWSAAAVLVAAVLPATGRWVKRTPPRTPVGAVTRGASGYPGGPSAGSPTLWPGT